MARLSIVIPVLGKLKKLEDTLLSVLENRPAQCEIIVVLNEPYDDPYELAGEVCFIQAPLHADLVECLNLGVASSRGSIVHTLACGAEVTPGWTGAVLEHFARNEVAAVAPWLIDRSDRKQSLSTGVGYRPGGAAWRIGYRRSLDSSLPQLPDYFGPDLVAAFYRKSAWEAVGGLCLAFTGYVAGADMALALRLVDRQCVREPNCRILADRSDLPEGERLGDGCEAERLFWRWARRMGWFRAIAGHAVLIFNECMESVVHPTTLVRLFCRIRESIMIPFRSQCTSEPGASGIPQDSVIARPHFRQTLDQQRSMEISKAS